MTPEVTLIDRCNKAHFACLKLTGARIGALTSLRIKHVNIVACCILQDAREVRAKATKAFTTWFLSLDRIFADILRNWVEFLVKDMYFGPLMRSSRNRPRVLFMPSSW